MAKRTTKYHGIWFDPKDGRWCVYIWVDGKRILVGSRDEEIDAARTYDRAARHFHGADARLNFPKEKLPAASVAELRAEQRAARASTQSSPYRGVGWAPGHGTWEARISVGGGKLRLISRYPSEEEAAEAYDRVARKIHGAAAKLNFPERTLEPATIEQMRRERRAAFKATTPSRYRGVSWMEDTQTWAAKITLGKVHALGRWAKENDAALAYDRAARFLYADEAIVNFPRRATPPTSPEDLRREAAMRVKTETSSTYFGVVRNSRDKWLAFIDLPTKEWLGEYDDEEEAARAHDRAVVALGSASIRNFPGERVAPATPAQLRRECRDRFKENTSSRYTGVTWVHRQAKWRAYIQVDRRVYQLGTYDDEVAAARAYDAARARLRGEGPYNLLDDAGRASPRKRPKAKRKTRRAPMPR